MMYAARMYRNDHTSQNNKQAFERGDAIKFGGRSLEFDVVHWILLL